MIQLLIQCFRKPLTYKILSCATGALCSYLFILVLFFPGSFLDDVQVARSESAFFVARRTAMMMLGLAVLCLYGRNAAPSAARQAISLSICVTMGGLALLGSWEYLRGFAGSGLLPAVFFETLLFAAYGLLWFTGRTPATLESEKPAASPARLVSTAGGRERSI